MNKICTSKEQSQKLIDLGIDVITADMDYVPFANSPKEYDCVVNMWNNKHESDWVPAWSLSALLSMIDSRSGLSKDYDTWICYDNSKSYVTKHYLHPIDAAFEMICWLKKRRIYINHE